MLVERKERVCVDMWKIAPHVKDLETSIIREILKISSQPQVISFAGGLPAPELFPLQDLSEAFSRTVENYQSVSMQYSLSRGVPLLREILAERANERGSVSEVDNILVTSGGQQGIELIARTFTDPGDYILTEHPTYVGALQAFNYYQTRYTTVEMDDDGMIVDKLEEKLVKYKPKFIYTVSNFQNPTGICLSLARRKQLVEVARAYDTPIIDDDPYGDIRFSGEQIPTLKSIGGDQVIAVSTFSKLIAPGLRIGWINASKEIIPSFEKVKQCADLHTNTLCQYIIYEYIKAGKLEPHIERIKADYRAKRDVMLKAMKETFPEGIRWTNPEGGLFLWVELPSHMSAKELLPKAVQKKVAYVYGQPFFPDGSGANTLRLNFSNASHEDIVTGITRLGTLFMENM